MVNLVWLIQTIGYAGVFAIIFAESGLLIGFFLPGDSLLFTAGFLASQGYLDIYTLAIGAFIAAALGDSAGYAFGRKIGPAIFNRQDSFLFHKKNIDRSHRFFERHGGKALILARFMPVVRTFVPILAGVGHMRYTSFLAYNVIGALLWGTGMALVGYFLGEAIPEVDQYLLPIIIFIIALSVLPSFIHVAKDREHRATIVRFIKARGSKKRYEEAVIKERAATHSEGEGKDTEHGHGSRGTDQTH